MPELGPESLTFTDKLVIYEIARGTFTAPSLLLQAMGITEELSARIRENWRVFFEPDEAYFIGDLLERDRLYREMSGLKHSKEISSVKYDHAEDVKFLADAVELSPRLKAQLAAKKPRAIDLREDISNLWKKLQTAGIRRRPLTRTEARSKRTESCECGRASEDGVFKAGTYPRAHHADAEYYPELQQTRRG